MIIEFILQSITTIISILSPEFLTSLPEAFHETVGPLLSFVTPLELFLPVATVFTILGVILYYEVGLKLFQGFLKLLRG